MWPLESSKARAERELELERARRACESKRTALVQCERVNARGMCEGLSRDHDFCRASRVKPCHGAAEAFDKCARRAMNLEGGDAGADVRERVEGDAEVLTLEMAECKVK